MRPRQRHEVRRRRQPTGELDDRRPDAVVTAGAHLFDDVDLVERRQQPRHRALGEVAAVRDLGDAGRPGRQATQHGERALDRLHRPHASTVPHRGTVPQYDPGVAMEGPVDSTAVSPTRHAVAGVGDVVAVRRPVPAADGRRDDRHADRRAGRARRTSPTSRSAPSSPPTTPASSSARGSRSRSSATSATSACTPRSRRCWRQRSSPPV